MLMIDADTTEVVMESVTVMNFFEFIGLGIGVCFLVLIVAVIGDLYRQRK